MFILFQLSYPPLAGLLLLLGRLLRLSLLLLPLLSKELGAELLYHPRIQSKIQSGMRGREGEQ